MWVEQVTIRRFVDGKLADLVALETVSRMRLPKASIECEKLIMQPA